MQRHGDHTRESGGAFLVLGLGDSGVAAARLLRAEGRAVTALDTADRPELRAAAERLTGWGVSVQLGATELPAGPFRLGVVSPGVPATSPWLAELGRRGVPVIPELELGWSRRAGRAAAVTGSNGKSTAVKLLAESLQAAGLRAAPCGNYGPPVAQTVREQPDLEWLALEVSTFQLETAVAFRADVGILLNIHPNHLDRHGTLAAYRALKARLFACTLPRDICLVHEPLLDDIRALAAGGQGRWLTFGAGAGADYRYAGGCVLHAGRTLADLRGTHFENDVLGLAAAAVAAALHTQGMPATALEQAARAFQPLPHRLQPAGAIGGVRYVNDSKATNLAATAAALRMLPGRVRLIAGGLLKETDCDSIKPLLIEKTVGVYLIGKAAAAMQAAWAADVPCRMCGTLENALEEASREAAPGDAILLSPACASFDQFSGFEERGERFAAWVEREREKRNGR